MVRVSETDDASEERRPKKKKKKPQSQVGLWIGLGVGGGVLLILAVAGVVGVIIATRAGEPQAKAPLKIDVPAPPPMPVVQQPQPPKDIGEKKRDHTNIRLRAERPQRLNELRNIALFYVQYRDTFNRPPKTADEFTEYIKRDAAAIKQAIDEKYYVLVPNVRGEGIVAYERDPDTNSYHGVARASTPVEEISTAELLKQLKAQGSQ